MKALFKFSSLSVWVICVSLVACTDHQEPGTERLRIKKLTRSLPYQHGYSVVSILGYDWQGRLDSVYSYQTADSAHSPTQTSNFQYDNQGRLAQMKRTLLIATTTVEKGVPATSVSTTDFVYDDHPNPFYGISLIPAPVGIAAPTSGNFSHYTYCGGVDNFLHLSRNNPTSSNIKGYTQTLYRYQYNALGLPESRVTLVKPMLDLPAVLSETLLFEYETY
ncbi:hypothetical protein [Dyadobacter sp. 22481]|uniref:hypothetical protein n=1 Tax=Dyadobacter sp. 22481 TaxID=3453926 RepID=UPI003F859B67